MFGLGAVDAVERPVVWVTCAVRVRPRLDANPSGSQSTGATSATPAGCSESLVLQLRAGPAEIDPLALKAMNLQVETAMLTSGAPAYAAIKKQYLGAVSTRSTDVWRW